MAWKEENSTFDFPFASHFLQEEVWLIRAALRINDLNGLATRSNLPTMIPTILGRYRALAKQNIARQSHLDILRSAIKALRQEGHCVGVASNDREFATRAMLTWAGLDLHLSFVFTSEGLSQKFPAAEKPAPEFFRAIETELRQINKLTEPIVYVGDSEMNDIIPSLGVGWIPVRFFNPSHIETAPWVATYNTTVAPVSFRRFEAFLDVLRSVVIPASS
jgi:FMN phosphatase YigB (HAD superfamily)